MSGITLLPIGNITFSFMFFTERLKCDIPFYRLTGEVRYIKE